MKLWKTKKRAINMGAVLGLALLMIRGAFVHSFVTEAQEKSAANEVRIDNFMFSPMELTIAPGTQVTWINKDDVPHTIVSVEHKFKSKALDTDEKFSFTFQDPGTYEYFCSVHPKMTGKITVK